MQLCERYLDPIIVPMVIHPVRLAGKPVWYTMALLFGTLLPSQLHSQEVVWLYSLDRGAVVRMTFEDGSVQEGRLLEAISGGSTEIVYCPHPHACSRSLQEIVRLERWTRSATRMGNIVGGVVGAVLLGGLVASLGANAIEETAGAVVGGVVGGFVVGGLATGFGSWERVRVRDVAGLRGRGDK